MRPIRHGPWTSCLTSRQAGRAIKRLMIVDEATFEGVAAEIKGMISAGNNERAGPGPTLGHAGRQRQGILWRGNDQLDAFAGRAVAFDRNGEAKSGSLRRSFKSRFCNECLGEHLLTKLLQDSALIGT